MQLEVEEVKLTARNYGATSLLASRRLLQQKLKNVHGTTLLSKSGLMRLSYLRDPSTFRKRHNSRLFFPNDAFFYLVNYIPSSSMKTDLSSYSYFEQYLINFTCVLALNPRRNSMYAFLFTFISIATAPVRQINTFFY